MKIQICINMCRIYSTSIIRVYVEIYMWYKEVLDLSVQVQIHTFRRNVPVYWLNTENKIWDMTFLNDFYRCHPKTRFEKTRVTILKHYKHYPLLFHIAVKIFKEIPSGEFSCIIYIEHQHNHPIKALQSLSFKSITYLVASSIRHLFEKDFRGGSRAAATTKMECFVIIVKR